MIQWTCTVCLKTFKRKGDFTRHSLIHQGNPAHRCEICGKSFYQFSGLKTHWNVHTGAKPFQCGIGSCRKAFGDPSSCSRHRKEIHGGGVIYRCKFRGCKTTIKRRSAFAEHLRSRHHEWAGTDLDEFCVRLPQFEKERFEMREMSIHDPTPEPPMPVPEQVYPQNVQVDATEAVEMSCTAGSSSGGGFFGPQMLYAFNDNSPTSTPPLTATPSPASSYQTDSIEAYDWQQYWTSPMAFQSSSLWPAPSPYMEMCVPSQVAQTTGWPVSPLRLRPLLSFAA